MSHFKGNSCLSCLQKFSNLALLIVSFGFINIGGFLAFTTQSLGTFPLIFIGLGVLELLLAFFAICKNNSKGILSFYIYVMMALIGAQAIASIVAIVLKEDIIRWAEENQSVESQAAHRLHELISQNVSIALYCAISATGVQILCLLITYCYKATLKRVEYDLESQETLMARAYLWQDNEDSFNERETRKKLENIKNKVKAKYRTQNELEQKLIFS